MKIYLRLLKYMRPYSFALFLAIICMVTFALTNGAMAYLIGPVLKFLFSGGGAEGIKLIPFNLFVFPKGWMIIAIPLIIFGVALFKGLSYFGQSYLMGFVGQRVVADLRAKLYSHILDLPIKNFSKTTTGTFISRITNDANMLHSTTVDSLATLLREGLTIIILAAVVIWSDWKLSLAAFVAFPLAIYPMMKFGKKMKKVSTAGQVTMGKMTTLLHETIAGIRIVKAFCMEAYESMRFSEENERLTKLRLKSIKVKSISSPLMELFGAIGFSVTIWYAAYRIHSGTLRPEAFMSFFAAVLMLYRPVKALNGVNLNISQGLAAAERVFDMLDSQSEGADTNDGAVKLKGIEKGIEFNGVSFKYGEDWILRDLNLDIERGEVIAIVGASGVGKTTLVNLIPRFYNVTDGTIMIDGVDLRDISISSLRAQIAIVSQQVILFNDTVKKNISYGDFSRSDEEIAAAAKAANADGFIKRMTQGYDTLIGESGIRLSGGERQRLSIARAILKNAPILILDEATSSLDTESEAEVQKGLNNLIEGRTTFVIAHRLSTIRNADRIIVLADGKIKEIGMHEELLRLDGEYSRLYSMQFINIHEGIAT
jgi:subfamily B ATP-binding cassette protein MsbA